MLNGLEYVDVPANSQQEYKLCFSAYKPGVFPYTVKFLNEETGEYQFHEITFEVQEASVMDVIQLTTPVRQTARYALPLFNPLNATITANIKCSLPNIIVPKAVVVFPQQQISIPIEYSPLIVEEADGTLEVINESLGIFPYGLHIQAFNPPNEKITTVQCLLGTKEITFITINNKSNIKADFAITSSTSDFSTVNSISINEFGSEIVEVIFEPSATGEYKQEVKATSKTAGEYIFPIHTTCLPPKPLGPIRIKTISGETAIPFRNIFNDATLFKLSTSHPAFILTEDTVCVPARKDVNIQVAFAPQYEGIDISAQLIVHNDKTDDNEAATWVYYIRNYDLV